MHIPGADLSGVTKAVTMAGDAIEHIGNGFNATVGMHGKTAQRTFQWIVKGKMVKEQEGILFVAGARAASTPAG